MPDLRMKVLIEEARGTLDRKACSDCRPRRESGARKFVADERGVFRADDHLCRDRCFIVLRHSATIIAHALEALRGFTTKLYVGYIETSQPRQTPTVRAFFH